MMSPTRTRPTDDETPAGLRFGLLVGPGRFNRWQAETIRSLVAVDGVSCGLVVVDARPTTGGGGRRARVERIWRSPTRLWDLYNNGWVGRRAPGLRADDVSDVLESVPRLDVVVDKQGWSEYFTPADVDAVRAHDLDFLIRLGFGIIRGDILEAARFGVWSFHHDDEEEYRGSPPAFWELVDDAPVSGAVLQRLTDALDRGFVLEKGWFATARHSYPRNTDTVHLGSTDWPAAIASSLLAGDLDAGRGAESASTAKIFKKPDDATTARFLGRQGLRQITRQVTGVVAADHWEIGVVRAPIERFLEPSFMPDVEWLGVDDPAAHYTADPFVLPTEDGPVVLYERYDKARRTGEIWEVDLDRPSSARPSPLGVTNHASYPYCFADGDRTYCVPQIDDQATTLYERVGDTWKQHGELVADRVLLDPTIIRHGQYWWLFATLPGRFSNDKLHLWYADDVRGPWHEHARNPVKTDVRSARPAGTPFEAGGRLHRPAQDCAAGYGAAVALCEIDQLDPLHFREHVVHVVRPQPDWSSNRGLHTISSGGDLTVLDARRRVIDRHEVRAELAARVRRLRGR